MSKKCSTDQSFIRKRNTTYKIETLVTCYNAMQVCGCWGRSCCGGCHRCLYRTSWGCMKCWSSGPGSWCSDDQEPRQEPWCHPDGDPRDHPELARNALDNCSSCEWRKEILWYSVNDSVIKIGVRNCIFRRLAAKTNHLSSSSADNCWIYITIYPRIGALLRGPFVLVSEWIYWVCEDT